MSSKIFDRLEALTRRLGMNTAHGTFTRAELAAYAAAVELAEESADKLLNNLFVDTADSDGLAGFLGYIGESPESSDEKTRQLILKAVQRKKQLFSKTAFDKYISSLNGSTYTVQSNEIMLDLKTEFGAQSFEAVSALLREYIPFTSLLTLTGWGKRFYAWGALNMPWYMLESYKLPFYVIDKF